MREEEEEWEVGSGIGAGCSGNQQQPTTPVTEHHG